MRFLHTGLLATALLVSGCADGGRPASERDVPGNGPPDRPAAANRIDPSTLARGDSVAGLRVDAIDVRPSLVDSTAWTGFVQFDGQLSLTGTYRAHAAFPEPEELCFFPDEPSSEKLPVFPNDERYAWLCFMNQQEAWEMLGRPPAEGSAAVTVDRYRYHYAHSDVYNTARLLDVQSHAPEGGAPDDSSH